MDKAPTLAPVAQDVADSETTLRQVRQVLDSGPRPNYSYQIQKSVVEATQAEVLQRLHTDINRTHRAYLDFQAQAMQQLLHGIANKSTKPQPEVVYRDEIQIDETAWGAHHGFVFAGMLVDSALANAQEKLQKQGRLKYEDNSGFRGLECELVFCQGLPRMGTHLSHQNSDLQASGQSVLQVKQARVGVFTEHSLSTSRDMAWDPANKSSSAPRLSEKTTFDQDDIQAFIKGDLVSCFGEKFSLANCHQRTPTIPGDRITLFDYVEALDFNGGPWGRGYLKAILHRHRLGEGPTAEALMFEVGVRLLSFYLASMGYTLVCDGWRFEPIKNKSVHLACRSPLLSNDDTLTYELCIDQVTDSPNPTVYGDLVCRVGEHTVCVIRGLGVELVPGWPMESRQGLLSEAASTEVAIEKSEEGVFHFNEHASLACAWGRPSDAFGPFYKQFDGPRRGPRLPGSPYNFISRIRAIDSEPRLMKAGVSAVVEYDVDPDAWYFDENTQATMPFPVLLEAALQPCGWLATYIGGGYEGEEELFFRNLDGSATAYQEVFRRRQTLTTTVKNTSVSKVGTMTILAFEVSTSCSDTLIYKMETVFGFFPKAALAEQSGIPGEHTELKSIADELKNRKTVLSHRPPHYFSGGLRLPGPMLNLLDAVQGYWPEEGVNKSGRVISEMAVRSQAWFFKSHFYRDPVQPGSLGLEMMLQTLQFFAIEQKLGEAFVSPRFKSVACDSQHKWQYRGQVLPHNKKVICDVHLNSIDHAEDEIILSADASLWVDDLKIYHAKNIGLAIVESDLQQGILVDAGHDTWIQDHCPTYTLPALPFMSTIDYLCTAVKRRVPGKKIVGLHDVRAQYWIVFNENKKTLLPLAVATSASEAKASLHIWDSSKNQYKQAAEGCVVLGEQYALAPKAWPALPDVEKADLPYDTGELFHGPSFQALTELSLGPRGASATVDASAVKVPHSLLNPGFLDACLHAIPHEKSGLWFDNVPDGMASYPLLLESASFFGEAPTAGLCSVELRPKGIHKRWQLPCVAMQIRYPDGSVWAEIVLIETLMQRGPLGTAAPQLRHQFFIDRQFVDGMRLSWEEQDQTVLTNAEVKQSNWLPGTLENIYGIANPVDANIDTLTEQILAKEYFSQRFQVHPQSIVLQKRDEVYTAASIQNVLIKYTYCIEKSDAGEARRYALPAGSVHKLDASHYLDETRFYWRDCFGTNEPNGSIEEDIFLSLANQFIGKVKFLDASALVPKPNRKKTGVLFVANHQVGVESMLFCIICSALYHQDVVALAKQEHKDSWIGRLLSVLFEEEAHAPNLLMLVDREDPQQVFRVMLDAMTRIVAGRSSVLVHATGTRALAARDEVSTLSTTLLSAAVEAGVDIVPVRFSGALPLEALNTRLEFPVGYTQQDWLVGQRITAESLKPLNANDKKTCVLTALNELDGLRLREKNNAPDDDFSETVKKMMQERGINETQAVLRTCLMSTPFTLSGDGQHLVSFLKGDKKVGLSNIDARLRNIASVALGLS